MDADAGIGDARAARHEADAGRTRQLAIGGSHEGRAAFVAAKHIVEPAMGVVQRVENGEIAFAGNAEALGRAESNQALDKKVTAIADHAAISSRLAASGSSLPFEFIPALWRTRTESRN